ncbi:MAG: NUDIX hydrolase [Planctomycetota bacterium]
MKRLAAIDVVEDRAARSRPDEGFLRLRRLTLVSRYTDGSRSRPYACDIVSRRNVDAVAVVLHDRPTDGSSRVRVALRESVRPPVLLRADHPLAPSDGAGLALLAEIVAGVIEEEDVGADGVERRAAAECEEEAGYPVSPVQVLPLGASSFPSPGVTDERVHFRRVEIDLDARGEAAGDGSVMEEAGEVVLLPLREAIRRCRRGEIPDMKTEIGLLRLADALGYVPPLDRFLDELPAPLRAAAAALEPLLPEDGRVG